MQRILFIAIGCALLSFCLPALSFAQSPSEIQARIAEMQRQREALLEEQRRLQSALNALDAQEQTLQGTVKSLDASRKKLETDLKVTQNSISTANLTISKLEGDIDHNEYVIETSREAIKESLRKLASYDSHGIVYDLLAYKNLSDVWSDTTNLLDTQDALGAQIAELQAAQKELVQNKNAKEAQKSRLVTLSSELSGQKRTVDATRTAQQKLLTETQSKEAAYQRLLAENIAREKEFEAQLFQYEQQLKASDRSTTPQAAGGIIGYPVSTVMVTQHFGRTASSGRLYASGTHNGIDFRAAVGTPILAVRGGVIQGQGNTDDQPGCYSYGRWILIKHDNGLSSLYAHLSATVVTTGQAVAQGQVIGYSGGTPRAYGSGYSTGPHLHLGLFASAGVQISRYSTSINCKNVSIPIANPQDYLDPAAYLPRV